MAFVENACHLEGTPWTEIGFRVMRCVLRYLNLSALNQISKPKTPNSIQALNLDPESHARS